MKGSYGPKMVEAAGIEPASETDHKGASPRSAPVLNLASDLPRGRQNSRDQPHQRSRLRPSGQEAKTSLRNPSSVSPFAGRGRGDVAVN